MKAPSSTGELGRSDRANLVEIFRKSFKYPNKRQIWRLKLFWLLTSCGLANWLIFLIALREQMRIAPKTSVWATGAKSQINTKCSHNQPFVPEFLSERARKSPSLRVSEVVQSSGSRVLQASDSIQLVVNERIYTTPNFKWTEHTLSKLFPKCFSNLQMLISCIKR